MNLLEFDDQDAVVAMQLAVEFEGFFP